MCPQYMERPNDKILSVEGMAAIMDEHTALFGSCRRMAELLDVAAPPKCWNYFGTLLHVDVLASHDGEPLPTWDEGQPDGDFRG